MKFADDESGGGPQPAVAAYSRIPFLDSIRQQGKTWEDIAPVYGVTHPDPPWKTSLIAMCESLAANNVMPTLDRRSAEDDLGATIYRDLPAPENQLLSLVHLMMVRELVTEEMLAEKVDAVKARLTIGR